MSKLRTIGGDVESAMEDIGIPSYVIDASGVIRWTNEAARKVVGDVCGRQFTSLVAPEDVHRARALFARKIVGNAKATEGECCLLDPDGERIAVDVSSVPLMRGGHAIGVFGQVLHAAPATTQPHHALTPRQAEILRLLEHGRSTPQIAEELHLSLATVRNHIRHMLRALGVHSRLEAVALARQEQLVA
jgi:PAS domain S-box-containing protein